LLKDATIPMAWQEMYCIRTQHVDCPYYQGKSKTRRAVTHQHHQHLVAFMLVSMIFGIAVGALAATFILLA
jgi:hypothetical protein